MNKILPHTETSTRSRLQLLECASQAMYQDWEEAWRSWQPKKAKTRSSSLFHGDVHEDLMHEDVMCYSQCRNTSSARIFQDCLPCVARCKTAMLCRGSRQPSHRPLFGAVSQPTTTSLHARTKGQSIIIYWKLLETADIVLILQYFSTRVKSPTHQVLHSPTGLLRSVAGPRLPGIRASAASKILHTPGIPYTRVNLP